MVFLHGINMCTQNPKNFIKIMINLRKFIPTKQKIEPIDNKRLRRELRTQLKGKLSKKVIIFLVDKYFTPINSQKVIEIYKNSGLLNKKYIPEKFDCDNYAQAFYVAVAESARKNRKLKYPYAFGVVMGNIPMPHAINWFMDEGKKVWFIEPQSGKIFKPKGKNILFLYSG